MATVIRAEISENNKYYIGKHRYYELKHFCLQYPGWKKSYIAYSELLLGSPSLTGLPTDDRVVDLTAKYAIKKAQIAEKMKMIDRAAVEADEFLYPYLIKGVTEGVSYTYLKTKMNIPCGRDTYYDRYRRFFWLLANYRDQ